MADRDTIFRDMPTRERASQLFAALAHPARLRIMEFLTGGGRTVGDIAREMELSQSGTSQHLAVLTRAGLLVMEPHGTARVYRVRGPRIGHVLALINEFCQIHHLSGPISETDEETEETG